jgi:hypothetical protein
MPRPPLRKDKSPFRFTRAALDIQTAKRSQRLVLFALAVRMNSKSETYFARYEHLMLDTGLSRKHLCLALEYLRDVLRVLRWKRGHSGLHSEDGKGRANSYSFNWPIMARLAEKGAKHRSEAMAVLEKSGRKDTPTTIRTRAPFGEGESAQAFASDPLEDSPAGPLDDWPSATADTAENEPTSTPSFDKSILSSISDESYIPPSLQVARTLKAQEVTRCADNRSALSKACAVFEPAVE